MFDLVGAALALRSAQIIALQAALLQQPLVALQASLLQQPLVALQAAFLRYGVKVNRTVICFDKQALFLGFGSGDAT